MNKNLIIIQTIGNTHSGSTLLSIILGSSVHAFNAGELKNIFRDSIFDEYCSCGEKVGQCKFWNDVFELWSKNSCIDFVEFKKLYFRYERVVSLPIILSNYVYESKDFKKYIYATQCLFLAIRQVSGSDIIIDSSKMPQRAFILAKLSNYKSIHICREFIGVLNSSKKERNVDIKNGTEKAKKKQNTVFVLVKWLYVNAYCEFIGLFFAKNKIKFKELISNSIDTRKIQSELKDVNSVHIINADHMIAGNRMRLKKNINIEPKIDKSYNNLSVIDRSIANIIDKLFFFWN